MASSVANGIPLMGPRRDAAGGNLKDKGRGNFSTSSGSLRERPALFSPQSLLAPHIAEQKIPRGSPGDMCPHAKGPCMMFLTPFHSEDPWGVPDHHCLSERTQSPDDFWFLSILSSDLDGKPNMGIPGTFQLVTGPQEPQFHSGNCHLTSWAIGSV